MHRTLRIQEIAESIALSLDPRTLLALALTCRTLCEISLDVLWGVEQVTVADALQPLVATGAFQDKPTPGESNRVRLGHYIKSAKTRLIVMISA